MVLKKSDLDEIRKIIQEESQALFTQDFLAGIVESAVNSINKKFEKRFVEHESRIDSLNKEISSLKVCNNNLQKQLDVQEQFSRSLNIRIFNVPQQKHEDLYKLVLDIFNVKMKILNVSDMDIKKCYRVFAKLPSASNPRPPAILVRFTSDKMRAMILKNRMTLKSSGINIQEDLTQFRLKLFENAVKKFSKEKVWCHNCNIYVKYNDKVYRIDEDSDLNKINNDE